MMRNEEVYLPTASKDMEAEEITIPQDIIRELQIDVEKHKPCLNTKLPLAKIPLLFPQCLKKKNEDERFKKFLSVFQTLSINLPLVEALLEMPGYAKFMKELVTKKGAWILRRSKSPTFVVQLCRRSYSKRKMILGAFTIPCTIGFFKFVNALCDLGASINLMPYAIYKQLGQDEPHATTMRLLMADRSIKHPVGILYDILVKVDRFIFLVDFVILDCDIDAEIPIILGRPFLATGRALVDVETEELKFWVNDDEVTFNVCKSMRYPSDIHVISTDDVIDKAVANVSHLMCSKEPFEVAWANKEEFEVQSQNEVVAAFQVKGYSQRFRLN
ncbi:uncharacterized protein LOC125848802 [Solanum stenotomum]|uniref:uncharacterized protein LOC125848802 n=1 Tax=Solanum stenotomum TaxID=172797 RepID=UPI0020D1ECF4|nr:uncharacterized protein LOC125848802 [Solanum stenotomum]